MSESTPSRTEVIEQLKRMLSSATFRQAATQSALFRLLVMSEVDGKPLNEREIGSRIFGEYDPLSHKVRANISHVRDKIATYYDGPGRNDLVAIDLPPGPNYPASFSYKWPAEALHAFRQGKAFKARHKDFRLAYMWFFGAANRDRRFVEACAEAGETDLLRAIENDLCEPTKDPPDFHYPDGRSVGIYLTTDALLIDKKCWLASMTVAVSALFDFKHRTAGTLFKRALRIDRERTETSLWYAVYLSTIDRCEEALEIAKAQSDNNPGDAVAHIVRAGLLYLMRRHKEVKDSSRWISMYTGQDKQYIKLVESLNAIELGEERSFNLIEMRPLTRKDTMSSAGEHRISMDAYLRRRLEEDWQPFGEIVSFAYAIKRGSSRDREWAIKSLEYVDRRTLRSALAFLAVGNKAESIAFLNRAKRQCNFFLNWLHLLPMFDALRDEPDFQRLVDSIRHDI